MRRAKVPAATFTIAGLLALGSPGAVAGAAAAQAQCSNFQNGAPASELTSQPWAQQKLDFTDVWSLTRGEGVTVAVVDSGTDTSDAQLTGVTALDVSGTGLTDCQGHGTMVSGIIAARDLRSQHIPFLGVAPGVHLVSIKYTNDENGTTSNLAKAIRKAADLHAKVINVSTTTTSSATLQGAVDYAQSKDAVVVAAAGNTDPSKKESEQALYPASYPGVLSVGAVGQDGKVEDYSNNKSNIALVAPGKAVISTWPHGQYRADDGTSFSAPFVAGTAALVRAYHPNLDYRQVEHRVAATADGGTAAGSGNGMVNPLRAVTAVLPEESGDSAATAQVHPVSIMKRPPEDTFTRGFALSLVGGALAVAAVVIVGGLAIPAARRRQR